MIAEQAVELPQNLVRAKLRYSNPPPVQTWPDKQAIELLPAEIRSDPRLGQVLSPASATGHSSASGPPFLRLSPLPQVDLLRYRC